MFGATVEDDVLVGIGATLLEGSKVGVHTISADGECATENRPRERPYSCLSSIKQSST